MKHGMTFNGIRKDYVTTLRGKRRPAWAPLTRDLITVPGMAGAHNLGTQVEALPLDIPIVIESANLAELKTMKEDLADWLVTEEPKELIFDDEPDRIYYAMVNGGFDPDEIVRVGAGIINFICIDPHKYKTGQFSEDLNPNINVIHNSGTAETYPVFTATVNDKIANLDIVTEHGYMRVGQPEEVDNTPWEPETLIFHDDMEQMDGWGPATTVDNGYVSGNINTDGQAFYPQTFGTVIQPPMWQGPSMKKTLAEPIQDFKMEALVSLHNTVGLTGMIEIYLLDASDHVVGKIGIEDRFSASQDVYAKAKAGTAGDGTWIFTETYPTWKNFNGVLRLRREDNSWYAYVAIVGDDGVHNYMRGSKDNLYYLDVDWEWQNPITQIQVAFRMYPDSTPCPMRVKDLKVWKLNLPGSETLGKAPYIARAGDTITIDHKTNDIRVNGESRIDLKDFGASYFPLKKGDNVIQYAPADKVDLNVKWRERYK